MSFRGVRHIRYASLLRSTILGRRTKDRRLAGVMECRSCGSLPSSLRRSPSQQKLLRGSGLPRSWVQDVVSRALPGELWGAVNVLAAASKGYSQAARPSPAPPQAAAAADLPVFGDDTSRSQQEAQTMRERLDFKPTMSALDTAASLVIPAGICAILFLVTHPGRIGVLYGLGMTLIYAAWVAICRALLLERHYTERLVSESELGDEDSRFAKLHGINVHYKAFGPSSGSPKAAIHCFHGFGANTASWTAVHRKMVDALQSQVTTHDMPGFGLTERPADLAKYSLDFNGQLGRQVMDTELMKAGTLRDSASSFEFINATDTDGAEPEAAACRKEAQGAGRVPRIFMGHSLGGACAAAEAILNPEGVDALILVAPAVVAFGCLTPSGSGRAGEVRRDGGSCSVAFTATEQPSPPVKNSKREPHKNLVLRLAIAVVQAMGALLSGIGTQLLAPVTTVTLRAAVRSRAFWERGLARAWHDKAGVTPSVVDAYRQPQLVRGWEKGLIRFTAARLSGGRSVAAVLRDAWQGRMKPTQAELLADVVLKHNIKVLIIHGTKDALVPASNSRRLAALLPSAQLEVMEDTGHVPHEERPEQFLSIVQQFLDTVP